MRYLFALLFLAGCNATQSINTSNHIIQREAMAILNTQEITEAHKHAKVILIESSDIAKASANITNTTPWWADLLSYGFIALAIVGIVVLLWYTGIGKLIQKFIYSLGLFIPDQKKQQAKLLAEVKDETDPTTIREAIAAFRASDPAFDAAYKQVKGH